MKIINSSHPDRAPPTREEAVDLEICRCKDQSFLRKLECATIEESSIEVKGEYLRWTNVLVKFNGTKRRERQQREWLKNTPFPAFARLPVELRRTIWQLAMATYLEPRVHCVTQVGSDWNFVSNQPTPRFLCICHESRAICLKGQVMAFQTYLNPVIDTIYLPDPAHFQRDGDVVTNAEAEFRFRMATLHQLLKFFDTAELKHVQRISLHQDLFCRLPGNNFQAMFGPLMPNWKESIIIFRAAGRRIETSLKARLPDLSTRERKRREEWNSVRIHLKECEPSALKFRFAVLEG